LRSPAEAPREPARALPVQHDLAAADGLTRERSCRSGDEGGAQLLGVTQRLGVTVVSPRTGTQRNPRMHETSGRRSSCSAYVDWARHNR
jgi:hypothetical protein